ncbi:MAG: acetate--CoA ligase family protein, partial [Acidobacteriota bacterium]
DVIMLYLESFGNPRKFGRVTPEVARRKPIVAVKSGRSTAGSRAASSHSAALASPDLAVEALFEQAGVIRTDTPEQLLDVVMLLSSQPIPAGPRVGVITNAGGPGILLADACEVHGLELPEFSSGTIDNLRTFLPFQAGMANPIDMIASATPEQYARAVEVVGSDPKIDSLIIIYLPPHLHPPEEVTQALGRAAATVPAHKPVLTVFMSAKGLAPVVAEGTRGRLPCYGFPENAALALSAAERYGRWRQRPRGNILALDTSARSAIRAAVHRVLDTESGGSVWLEPTDLAAILKAAGVDFAPAKETDISQAAAVAERMGYPLVLKAVSEQILHKSDVGGVVLGIRSREQLLAAVETMSGRLAAAGIDLRRVLLQREIGGGIEALVGVTTDPTFGPLVVCGLGGVLVELLQDAAFRIPPVSDIDAGAMLDKLRARRLLDGYRGRPPGDREALILMIQRISALIELIPEMKELDLNPVKVLVPGSGAVVVDARLRLSSGSDQQNI